MAKAKKALWLESVTDFAPKTTTIKVYRYSRTAVHLPPMGLSELLFNQDSPRVVEYHLDCSRLTMVLDVMLAVRNASGQLSMRFSCREGICGSCAVNVCGQLPLCG